MPRPAARTPRSTFLLWLLVASVLPALNCSAVRKAPPCESIDLPESWFAAGRVVLFGDFHGTEEIPACFARVACAALRRAPRLIVALEISDDEKQRIDRYLDSPGAEADRTALLAGAFWTDAYQDGRRSRAMAALLERLRALRVSARHLDPPPSLEVLLLDSHSATSPGERDRRMADAILGALIPGATARKPPLVLALAGNLHTRTVKGAPWDASYAPLGYHLVQSLPEGSVVALDVAHLGGTAWFCTGADPASCGEKPLEGRAEPTHPTVRRFEQADDKGFRGAYFVGLLTASPPAVVAGAGAIIPAHAPPPPPAS